MQIEKEQLKKLVSLMMAQFKNLESDLLAHKMVILGLSVAHPEDNILGALELARTSPEIQGQVSVLDSVLEILLKQLDETERDQVDWQKLIETWQKRGQVH